MTEHRDDNVDRRLSYYDRMDELRSRNRIELEPAYRCWDVISCCGPAGDRVMIDTYDRGAHFLTPDEARQIARAVEAAARATERDAPEARAIIESHR